MTQPTQGLGTAPPEQREYVQQKRNQREEKQRPAGDSGEPATAAEAHQEMEVNPRRLPGRTTRDGQ
jgi:hypothetical protein